MTSYFYHVSGESKNLVNGLNYAIKNNIKTASLTGSNINNTLKENSNVLYGLIVNLQYC